jgi:hypothetical protein
MSFYSPSDSKFTRLYKDEVEMVVSAIDCVLNGEPAIYCSSELTSGLTVFEALGQYRVKTVAELKDKNGKAWFGANIWDVNCRAANEFARSVRKNCGGAVAVITPAPFSAGDWNQMEYLAFWEELVRTRIKSAWFNRNWEYSNGCTFEFAVAQDAGIPTFNFEGSDLKREAGLAAIQAAIERLKTDGWDTAKLQENLERLTQAR